jgi:hypothetical protein
MFSMSLGGRTARGFAAAALILSLTATTAGSANAAPLANETQDCSSAAHARNDAVHLLHTAWKAFAGDLKDLARDARKLQHESEKTSVVLTKDARSTVASAKAELKDIVSQAHEDIQAVVDLGTACKDEADDTTSTTTTTTSSVTAPTDATAPADTTGSAHTFDTSGLDSKYKGIVDQAIKDMQKVVDDARKALLDMTAVAESKDTTEKDADKVEQEVEKATADRAAAKQDREEVKKADKAKAAKVKATTKSQNSDKGNAKTKAKVRNANEERD